MGVNSPFLSSSWVKNSFFFVRGWKQLLPALKPGANCNSTGTGQKCHGILEYLFRVVNVTDSVCLSFKKGTSILLIQKMCICACLCSYDIASCVLTLLFDCPPNGFFYFGSPEKLLIKSGELRLKILIFLSVRKMDELTREKMQFWILKKNPILITLWTTNIYCCICFRDYSVNFVFTAVRQIQYLQQDNRYIRF